MNIMFEKIKKQEIPEMHDISEEAADFI